MQLIAKRPGSRLYSGTKGVTILAVSVLLAVFMLLFPCSSGAQGVSADVLGTVTDSTGAVVPDAKVVLKNVNTGITNTVQSNKTGEFIFTHLQIGTYKVTIEAKGFKTFVQAGVTLNANDRVRVDGKMQIGSQVETVEIAATAAPELKTDSSTMDTTISTTAVADLPLNGRNLTNLVQLSAGVTQGASNAPGGASWTGGHQDDLRQTSAFSANGQNDINNNQMVDGMDNNERAINTQILKPSPDATDQVIVMTNLYPAEYGRTAGGIMNVITKSGGNKFHGSLYEYLRNDMFDANPYQCGTVCGDAPSSVLPKAEYRQNQFGGSLGGHILKDKAFFFGEYQGFRVVSGAISGQTYAAYPDYADWSAVENASVGQTVEIGDPLQGNGPYKATVTQLGKNMMALYNGDLVKKYVSSPSQVSLKDVPYTSNTIQNADSYTGRLDYHFSDKDMLFARYSWQNTNTLQPAAAPAATVNSMTFNNQTPSTITTQGLAFDYVHTLSSSMIFEGKAGFARFWNFGGVSNPKGAATALGFPGCTSVSSVSNPDVFCTNTPYGGADTGLPGIGFNGRPGTTYTGFGDAMWGPLTVIDTTFQYQGSLTWNHGNHSVKAGASLVRRQLRRLQSPSARGGYAFAGSGAQADSVFTGDGLADMAQSVAGGYNIDAVMSTPDYRSWEPSMYVQDDWRALPWLTLNLGVRYDLYTPYTDAHGVFSNFDEATGTLDSPDMLGLYHGSNTGNISTDYSNISPRLGFSASLQHQIVVRGGVGVSYFPNEVGGGTVVSMDNAPYSWNVSYGMYTRGQGFYTTTIPSGVQPKGVTGTCGAQNLDACAMNMAAGAPEPYLDGSTASNMSNANTSNVYGVDDNLKSGRLVQYSLELQKQWGANVLGLRYVGNQGRHLPNPPNIEQPAYATPTAASLAAGCSTDSVTAFSGTQGPGGHPGCVFTQGPVPYTAATTLNGQDLTGIMITDLVSDSTSNYNSMQVVFTRQMANGLGANVNYTYAHAMDNGSPQGEGGNRAPECVRAGCLLDLGNGQTKTITRGLDYDYGNSDLDVRHRITAMLNYTLPFAKNANGILGIVAKGWGLNATGVFATSMPVNIGCANGFECNVSGIIGLNSDAPSQISNKIYGDKKMGDNHYWFNAQAFAAQSRPGTLGNAHRNSLFGPNSKKADMSLVKDFNVYESAKLQFRAEAFNFTNTVTFGAPNANHVGTSNIASGESATDGSAPYFGQISSTDGAYQPRLIQLALRLSF